MIKVSDLKKSYGGQVVFDGASFVLSRGERVGLVGRNGTGKTTLFKMILKEEEPDGGCISAPRHYTVGHLSQHIHFTEDTVLKEGCLSLPLSEDGVDETYRVETILAGLGIPEEWFGMDPRSLSGGYQIRLNLAKALASDPDLLLLDEPTNYLDIVSVRWLKRFLCNWKNELMIITHDRDFMDSVTTHTMAVHRHKIRKVAGPTHKLYSQLAQEEEIYEKTRLNDEKKRKEIEVFINRFRAQATKASSVQSRVKALERTKRLEKLEEARTLDFEFNSAPFPGKFFMEVKGLTFGFEEGAPLIRDLSLSVGKNDRIAIIGKNGRGKTTLLNLLAGELVPSLGSINRHDSLRLAYFGQTNISRLNLKNTIEQEIMESHPDCGRAAARRACGAMMFEKDNALKKIEVLSGGERSRVLLGKILVSPANLLLLDEPTNHLDMDSIDALIEAIDAFSGAVIIVTHSELMLDAVATRLIVFDGGGASLFEGAYRDFLERVGWENEADARAGKARAGEGKSVNKKELRRLRAETVSERNRTLGPLKARMEGIENAIVEMEKEAEEMSRALLGASENGEADKIAALSRAYHASREKIDGLFDELEALGREHDAKAKEFEDAIAGIGGRSGADGA